MITSDPEKTNLVESEGALTMTKRQVKVAEQV